MLFVSQAPIFDIVRFGKTVGSPQVGELGVARPVAVLHPISCFLCGAGRHVGYQKGFGSDEAAVANEFIRPESIVLFASPDEIPPAWTLVLRSYTVSPVIDFRHRSTWVT